ncbi:MAG: polysaccharide deacetylase family protein [Candidatus Heimdallarchaeota archaeon]|nr:MAG: polysaccharide deacetylase family protein [Candidatus Heimdallarchaeota archaeon]
MSDQTLIEKLGFSSTDKVVIFHMDDVGFSHASNVASFECLDFGVATCGSVIVPAPWFLETASICKNNPKYDMGVHLTLTCEYDYYRWRALSTVDQKTGLLDDEGCLWSTTEEAVMHVTPEAAEKEMRAQIQRALDHGIDVTHIDSHMGTVVADPKFIESYLALGSEFKIPVFMPRLTRKEIVDLGFAEYADMYLELLPQLEANGTILMDQIFIHTGGEQPDKLQYYCDRMAEIKPGLAHFLFHPAKMTPELEAITPDSAIWRNQDYMAFTDKRIKDCIKKHKLKLIGYRRLRDYLRKNVYI